MRNHRSTDNRTMQMNRLSLLRLLVGASLGIILGLTGTSFSELDDPSIVAMVNHQPITRVTFDKALALFSADKRDTLTSADRQLVLNRLIDEELLLQQALNQGLLRENPNVRQRVLQTLLSTIAGQSAIGLDANTDAATTLDSFIQQQRQMATIVHLNPEQRNPIHSEVSK